MASETPREIAIVDDDPGVRSSLSFLLEVIGHPVRAFASATEFLNADIRDVFCLILDHHMPDMTGLHLAERLRAEGRAIPIMLITGSSTPAIADHARQLGIERVSEKPVTEEDLLDFIDASLGQNTPAI
jgi:FixJ family two-component response regulator